MRVAIRLPNTNRVAGYDALARVCRAAEDLGFHAVSADDHIVFDGSYISCGSADATGSGHDHDKLEIVTALSFAAAWTERVRLLAGVFLLPVREPILLAKQTSTLDFLSGGRLIVGAGLGGLIGPADSDANVISRVRRENRVREYRAFGVSGSRATLFDENLRAMVAIWTQDRATFHGQHVSFDELEVFPKPAQRPRPPLWIGGRSDAARKRSALLADAWFPSQISAAQYRQGIATVRQERAQLGVPEQTDHPVNLFASLGRTDEAAYDVGFRTVGSQFSTREDFDARTIMGSPATFRRRLEQYRDAGVDLVELKLLYPSIDAMLDMMRTIAQEVMPAVDARGSTAP